MCGDVHTQPEINLDGENGSDTAKEKGEKPMSAKSKLAVLCRFPYLTIKEEHELPKRYRKARQAQTH